MFYLSRRELVTHRQKKNHCVGSFSDFLNKQATWTSHKLTNRVKSKETNGGDVLNGISKDILHRYIVILNNRPFSSYGV